MIVDELIALLGFKLTGEREARLFQSRIKQLDSNLTRFASRATMAGTVIKTFVAGLAGGAVAQFGRNILETAGDFESLEARLTTAFDGSGEAAKGALKWIEDFAVKTPYAIGEITEALIYSKQFGLDPMAGDLQIIGDAASATGMSIRDAAEAVTDAMTKQYVRIKAFGISTAVEGDKLTFSWLESGKQVTKVLNNTGEEVKKFLLDFMSRKYAGDMVRRSKTFGGIMSNIGDAWTIFKRRIALAGGPDSFFNTVKNSFANLLDYIGKLDMDGTLDRWADNIGKAFKKVFDQFPRMAKHIKTIYDNFDTFKPALGAMGIGFLALAARAHPLTAALFGLGAVIEDIVTYKEGGDSVTGRIINTITKKGELKTLDQISKRLGELSLSIPLRWAFGDPKENKPKSQGAIEKLLLNTKNELLEIQKFVTGKDNKIEKGFQERFVNPVKNFLQGMDNALDATPFKKINDQFRSLMNFLNSPEWDKAGANLINHIWKGMKSAFKGLFDWWKSSFESLGSVSPNPRTYSVPDAPSGSVPSNYRDAMDISDPFGNLKGNVDRQRGSGSQDPYRASASYVNQPTVIINQEVKQATDAPRRAADATAKAVSRSASTEYYNASRIELEPAVP